MFVRLLIPTLGFLLIVEAAFADSEPRWVHIPDDPKALIGHFGMAEMNCYHLPENAPRPDDTLEQLQILHKFDPRYETPGDQRTDYSLDIALKVAGTHYHAFAQCHTSGPNLSCGIQCDGGPFTLFNAGSDHIILHNEGFAASSCGAEDGAPDLYMSPAEYGASFVLERMSDEACLAAWSAN